MELLLGLRLLLRLWLRDLLRGVLDLLRLRLELLLRLGVRDRLRDRLGLLLLLRLLLRLRLLLLLRLGLLLRRRKCSWICSSGRLWCAAGDESRVKRPLAADFFSVGWETPFELVCDRLAGASVGGDRSSTESSALAGV